MPKEAFAIGNIANGSVLLHAGTRLPGPLGFEKKPMLDGWGSDPKWQFAEFQLAVEQAGWHCFFVPPETQAGALGLSDNHALTRALRKLVAHAEREKLNALEVTTVQKDRLLGLYRARVAANLRHVQSTLALAPASERLLQETTPKLSRVKPRRLKAQDAREQSEGNLQDSRSNFDTRSNKRGGESYVNQTNESRQWRTSASSANQNQMDRH